MLSAVSEVLGIIGTGSCLGFDLCSSILQRTNSVKFCPFRVI